MKTIFGFPILEDDTRQKISDEISSLMAAVDFDAELPVKIAEHLQKSLDACVEGLEGRTPDGAPYNIAEFLTALVLFVTSEIQSLTLQMAEDGHKVDILRLFIVLLKSMPKHREETV